MDSKGKCRASSSAYVIIADENKKTTILDRLKEYKKIEEVVYDHVTSIYKIFIFLIGSWIFCSSQR